MKLKWFEALLSSKWKRSSKVGLNWPDDVVGVAQVEPLSVFPSIIHHSDRGHKVHHFFGGSVEQVIPDLVTSVAVDPLEPQPAARSRLIRHRSQTKTRAGAKEPLKSYTKRIQQKDVYCHRALKE